MEPASREAQELVEKISLQMLEEIAAKCIKRAGSPIETKFITAFFHECGEASKLPLPLRLFEDWEEPEDSKTAPIERCGINLRRVFREGAVYIEPQCDTEYRKVDYFFMSGDTQKSVVVECDGAAYHSKDKQFTRDRETDRQIIARSNGRITIMRFSGHEIYKDAKKCAKQVLDYLLAA